MNEFVRFILLVAIGGLIGYVTNRIAIKMLFRPVNPIKILFFEIQGVFPKRKDKIAVSLAETIEEELLSKDVIMDKILNEEKIQEYKVLIKDMLVTKIEEKIPPMVKMFLGSNPNLIKDLIDKEGDQILDDLIDKLKESGLEGLDIKEIVKEKIDSLDFVEFEKIIFGLMNKELRFVEIIGLFLGMFIGVIQYLVVTLF
jgi:uncharacterized membrane protein YheB (UPF0754 family)